MGRVVVRIVRDYIYGLEMRFGTLRGMIKKDVFRLFILIESCILGVLLMWLYSFLVSYL